MKSHPCFHLAIPVDDLETTVKFYAEVLNCKVGRSSKHSVILNFFGHQLVVHKSDEPIPKQKGIYPRHFGLVVDEASDWEEIASHLEDKGIEFVIEPGVKHLGEITEYRTMFFQDPSGHHIEIKTYKNQEARFEPLKEASLGLDEERDPPRRC